MINSKNKYSIFVLALTVIMSCSIANTIMDRKEANSSSSQIRQSTAYKNLIGPHTFSVFIQSISHEMEKIGLKNWGYINSGLPSTLALTHAIGTIDSAHIAVYLQNQFHDYAVLSTYLIPPDSIFQSEIIKIIEELKFTNKALENYKLAIAKIRALDIQDMHYIKIKSVFENEEFLFITTNKNIEINKYIDTVKSNSEKIYNIARAIDLIGIERYPEYFSNLITQYTNIKTSLSVKLLATMVSLDMSEDEVARYSNMCLGDVKKEISALKKYVSTNTVYGTYEKLKQLKYI